MYDGAKIKQGERCESEQVKDMKQPQTSGTWRISKNNATK
jgi:hypothetical protein